MNTVLSTALIATDITTLCRSGLLCSVLVHITATHPGCAVFKSDDAPYCSNPGVYLLQTASCFCRASVITTLDLKSSQSANANIN